MRLSAYEREILQAYEQGRLKPSKDAKRAAALLRQAAANDMRKVRRINIRLAPEVLDGLRRRAVEEGLPYQTLASSVLHKYVSGRLVERSVR